MNRIFGSAVLLLGLTACGTARPRADLGHIKDAPADGGKFYSFTVKDIDGKDVPLEKYRGAVLLVVNVASKCGNTPQYKGLEETYHRLHGRGFEVLGFPENDFLSQEPGTNAQIKEFCTLTYGVEFPMFSKINVKGDDMAPLYRYLTTETDFKGDIEWNFAKFLVNRQGRVVARFKPRTKIEETQVMDAILAALK